MSISESSAWQRDLQIRIPREQVEREEKKVLQQYRKKVKVDGFRAGKAPEKIVIQRHGDAIRSDAIENILPAAIDDALREHEISPLAPPRVTALDYGDDGPLEVKASVEVMPTIQVKGYKGLKLEKPVRPIEDQDVDEALEGLRERTAELVPVERRAEHGDYLLADIHECDDSGAPIIGRKSENRTLFLAREGEGSEVGRQLVGVEKGIERRVVIEHGEGAPDAAGHGGAHRHVYLVSVKEVKEKHLPSADDEYARALGDFEDLADLRRVIREDLQQQVEAESRRAMVGQAIDQLIKANKVEVPESLIQRYLDGVVQDYRSAAAEQGQQLVNEDAVRQEYRGLANVQLQWQILQLRIADQEDLSTTEEEVREEVAKFADRYGIETAEAWRALKEQGRLDRIRSDLREKMVVDLILGRAKIKERKISRKEMETPSTEVAAGGSGREQQAPASGSGLVSVSGAPLSSGQGGGTGQQDPEEDSGRIITP